MAASVSVRELFLQQQQRGAFVGGQLVVRRAGRVLLEVAAGHARGLREPGGPHTPVTAETKFQVMSASKPLIALAVAMLEDAKALSVEKPIAHYLPGFAAAGKGEITILDVLRYRSGVLMEDLVATPARWSDPEAVRRAVCEAVPRFARGVLAYQPASFGWILAEVIEQVTQQSLTQFFRERLPPSLAGLRLRDEGEVAETYWEGPRPFLLAGHDLASNFEEVNNTIAGRRAVVPGAGMYTTANDLARMYECFLRGGLTEEGRPLLSPETLGRYLHPQSSGMDKNLGVYLRLGRGVSFGWLFPHFYGWWNTGPCYGHAGGFSTVAFADPRTETAVAIVTNSNRGISDLLRRTAPLASAARALPS